MRVERVPAALRTRRGRHEARDAVDKPGGGGMELGMELGVGQVGWDKSGGGGVEGWGWGVGTWWRVGWD